MVFCRVPDVYARLLNFLIKGFSLEVSTSSEFKILLKRNLKKALKTDYGTLDTISILK